MKRVFGRVEAIFNICYLLSVLILAVLLFFGLQGNSARILAACMALVLLAGDAFHLLPRIVAIKTGKENELRKALGMGKQAASITMTLFYLLLWQIGILVFSPQNIDIWSYILYVLTGLRILFCLLPQNKWQEPNPPLKWALIRNTPFFLQGGMVGVLFFQKRAVYSGLGLMWLAIALSFAFYAPVVFWAHKKPKLGMLMLPKSLAYIWILIISLSL